MLKFVLSIFAFLAICFISLCTDNLENKITQILNSTEFVFLNSDKTNFIYTPIEYKNSDTIKISSRPKLNINIEEIKSYSGFQNFFIKTLLLDSEKNIITNSRIVFKEEDGYILLDTYSNNEGIIEGFFQSSNLNVNIICIISFKNNDYIEFKIPSLFKIDENIYKIKEISSIELPFRTENLQLFTQITKSNSIQKFPHIGFATLAFEDSYPSTMDGDYNDYVVQFKFEEKLNSIGEILEINGEFHHLAKGSNYNHSLHIRFLDENLELSFLEENIPSFESKINNSNDKFIEIVNEIDLKKGLQIFGDSNKTIQSKNVSNGSTFKEGYQSNFKISFNKPVSRKQIGFPPYDTYLKILSKPLKNDSNDEEKLNTSLIQNYHEIHLSNLYFDNQKKDIYSDSNNYPYTILVPEEWAWQYEGKDIRNERFTGYKMYSKYIDTKGKTNLDWYKHSNSEKLFPVPFNNSNLTAYIQGIDLTKEKISFLVLLILLLVSILYLRKKFISA